MVPLAINTTHLVMSRMAVTLLNIYHVFLQVLVNVNDINDNWPKFPNSYEGPFEITEGQPGPRVSTFKAEDKDSGLNGQVEYSIVGGDILGKCTLLTFIHYDHFSIA